MENNQESVHKIIINCLFARDVTATILVVKNKSIYLLGTKLYFHVNFSSKISIVLTPNMAALSCGCKPRIEGKH